MLLHFQKFSFSSSYKFLYCDGVHRFVRLVHLRHTNILHIIYNNLQERRNTALTYILIHIIMYIKMSTSLFFIQKEMLIA